MEHWTKNQEKRKDKMSEVSGSINHQALVLTNSKIIIIIDRLQSVKSIYNRQSRGFDVFASYRK